MQIIRLLIVATLLICSVNGMAADGKIIKVLPHLLDKNGKHTLSPSLYERDAYQAKLRNSPEEISALRFDVQWKSKASKGAVLKLKIEARGNKAGSKTATLEGKVNDNGFFSTWSRLPLSKEEYARLGGIGAWRATLWQDDKQIAELKSFLW
jgi:hypothetical protein